MRIGDNLDREIRDVRVFVALDRAEHLSDIKVRDEGAAPETEALELRVRESVDHCRSLLSFADTGRHANLNGTATVSPYSNVHQPNVSFHNRES